ncbi:alpha/beta hydrolase [Lysobacter rhizosphaerae]
MNPARVGSTIFLIAALLGSGCAHVAPAAMVTPEDIAQRSKVDTLQLDAPGVAPAPLRVRVYLPPDYEPHAAIGYPVLYVNDGQDMEAVGLQATFAALYAQKVIRPVIVVAIDMPPDRMGAYGLSDRGQARSLPAVTKYGPVGTQAHAYSEWVAKTLVPTIDARYRTRTTPDARAVLGWSLGALNAFNLGWQYPELFGRVPGRAAHTAGATDGRRQRAPLGTAAVFRRRHQRGNRRPRWRRHQRRARRHPRPDRRLARGR